MQINSNNGSGFEYSYRKPSKRTIKTPNDSIPPQPVQPDSIPQRPAGA